MRGVLIDFTREDWTLFRNETTLAQKAGVPVGDLAPLVIKELVDNALDAGANVSFSERTDGVIVIEDDGPGIDPERVTTLFSIRRPLTSSKIVRLPTRGALGNGLRVVMGAVYASHGSIVVETGGSRFELIPGDDGHTTARRAMSSRQSGTRIEIKLGSYLNHRGDALRMANVSKVFYGKGSQYKGKTSPWWYDASSFFELLQAAGEYPLATVLGMFRDIKTSDALFMGGSTTASDVDRSTAEVLLAKMRAYSKEPSPSVLGKIGEGPARNYSIVRGVLSIGGAHLPYVVEAYVWPKEAGDDDTVLFMVNRTMVTGPMSSDRVKPAELGVWGCGLSHRFAVPKNCPVGVAVNITTPYMPITSDGKAPDLKRYVAQINQVIEKSARKCKKEVRVSVGGVVSSQKAIVLSVLDMAIAQASGDGRYRYSLRQLYYAVRPYFLERGEELKYDYFTSVITSIENDRGELEGIYRSVRGVLHHPHTKEEIPLGTRAVEKYERPAWTFNKIIYIEKEGFISLLKEDGWLERNDCAMLTCQGFASRAARDVIDLLGETGEDIYFFCIHDADASGTMIYQSLVEATKARGARKVHVVNLGLEPQEALDMGLQVEEFSRKSSSKLPVADYLKFTEWDRWLQTQRVELNSMSSPEFIAWLDAKFAEHVGKVVPPEEVLKKTFDVEAEKAIRESLTEKILAEADLDGQVSALTVGAVAPEDIEQQVRTGLENWPQNRWDAPVREMAVDVAKELVA